jgi:hypothetical protein
MLSSTVAVGVSDIDAPKLRPEIVTLVLVLNTEFIGITCEATGESNENESCRVPTLADTVRMARYVVYPLAGPIFPEPRSAAPHWTVVCDVHAVVPQFVSPIADVGVTTPYPKFRPLIVTVPPNVLAMFRTDDDDAIGASYENPFMRVPTTADTVTTCVVSTALICLPPGGAAQSTAESEVQTVVEQTVAEENETVAVVSVVPRFMPYRVIDEPPDVPKFCRGVCVIIGASNENVPRRVPTTAEIVTINECFPPTPAGPSHKTEVVETQMDEAHAVLPIRTLGELAATPK